MRTLQVDPNFVDIPSYFSAAKAISAERDTPRAARSAADSLIVAGSTIREFALADQRIQLELSNGCIWDVAVDDKRVEWHVSMPSNARVKNATGGRESLRLAWPDGEFRIWNPGTLLRSRRVFQIERLFAGQWFLNINFHRGGILQFVPLWNVSDQRRLLYFFELEPVMG